MESDNSSPKDQNKKIANDEKEAKEEEIVNVVALVQMHEISDLKELATESKDSESPVLIATEQVEINEDIEHKLLVQKLLKTVNINKVYYVDDVIDTDNRSVLSGLIKTIDEEECKQVATRYFSNNDLPSDLPIDLLIAELDKLINNLSAENVTTIILNISEILKEKDLSLIDYIRANKLKDFFPEDMLSIKSPSQWNEVVTELKEREGEDGVLILFDKEINLEVEGRTLTGIDLIKQVIELKLPREIYCLLITHTIASISVELEHKNTILAEAGGSIPKHFFYPLSKERLDKYALFKDGIKKAILNKYLESLKDVTEKLARDAFEETIKALHDLDTYDFNHVILKSSQKEGTWEANTLIRILSFIFDEKIKGQMGTTSYITVVNNLFKIAKQIDKSPTEETLYSFAKRYKLRQNELYYKGDIINNLFLPLSNGDIFETEDEIGSGDIKKFILVSQDCDTMIRGNGIRTLSHQLSLYPIKTISKSEFLEKSSDALRLSNFKNDILQHKYVLEYFNIAEENALYFVDFSPTNVRFINPDILDLTSLNASGDAIMKNDITDIKEILSDSLLNRYNYLKTTFNPILKRMVKDTWNPEDKGIVNSLKGTIKVYYGKDINPVTYSKDSITYSFKRILRLKHPQSSILLEHVNTFAARYAEEHDFIKI